MDRKKLLVKIKSDLRALGKYEVLNTAYAYKNEEGKDRFLSLKSTKNSVMGIRLANENKSLVYNGGSVWDVRQKDILDYVDNFTKEK